MKTTLNFDDTLMKRLKSEAACKGCTMSELVEMALRRILDEPTNPVSKLKPLPKYDMGRVFVDLCGRHEHAAVHAGSMNAGAGPPACTSNAL